ncbi:MAG: putative MscS family protein [Bacteroidia bacterium]|nr:MAG: putative MscS family protein [Bacteroidia bacterium]
MNWLDRVFLGNTVEDYLWFAGWILLALIIKRRLSNFIIFTCYKLLKKYTEEIPLSDFRNLLGKPIMDFILLIFVYLAFNHLSFPPSWDIEPESKLGIKNILHSIYGLVIGYVILRILMKAVDGLGLILMKRAEKTETKTDDQIIPFLVDLLKILVVVFVGLIILSTVFNINIGTLVAGIGIGGLALAMASKETLENMLGSLVIFLDKPFVVGDLITINGITGVVEKVGIRSTRIRTLEKSYLTIPNKKLVDSELDNLTLRTFRRVRFNVGVTYGTKAEQIKKIVEEIQKYIDDHPHTNQDGVVRFHEFGDSALLILVQYFIDTMDWNIYLQIREEINFKIMEIVEKNGSSFAFPSTSVYIEKMPSAFLKQ